MPANGQIAPSRAGVSRVLQVLLSVLVVAACGTMPGIPAPAPALADPTAPASPDISGRWEGIFNTHPEIVRLTVDLESSGAGAVGGEVRFTPLVDRFHVGSVGTGRYTVHGRYDPEAGTLVLQPVAWVEGRGQMQALAFQGVYDSGYGAIAGVITNAGAGPAPYFALSRPERADDLLLGPAEYASRVRNVTRMPFGIGGRTEESDILAWGALLTREFPGRDPYRENIPEAENLFADAFFEPHFGTTYDRLNPFKRREIMLMLGQTRNPELRRFSGLGPAFQGTGTPAVQATTVTVLAQRILRSWLRGAHARLASPPGSEAGWREVAHIEAAGTIVLSPFWPSEWAAFARAVEAGRVRVVDGLLASRLDALAVAGGDLDTALQLQSDLAGAQREVAGGPGARVGSGVQRAPDRRGGRISDTPPSLEELWALASGEVQRKHEARARVVVGRIVGDAARAERARIAAFGPGLDGLIAGTRWYAGAYPLYGGFRGHAAVDTLFADFRTRRATLLRSDAATIDALLRNADDADELDVLLAAYLGVPTDREDPAGRRLLELGTGRVRELRAIETQAQLRNAAIKKILGAALLEAGRRASVENDDLLMQIGTTLGRDLLIGSALRDVFPDADERSLGYMVRWVGLVLSGDFSARGFTIETLRESIVQSWEAEHPESPYMARFADFMLELYLQRARSP
jgi:hypothetical protein